VSEKYINTLTRTKEDHMKNGLRTVIFSLALIIFSLGLLTGIALAEEPVIVPGERVGKFLLGMKRQEVLKLAPNPRDNKQEQIVYHNDKTGNALMLFMKGNVVDGIMFTNQEWTTELGLTLKNFDKDLNPHLFNITQKNDRIEYEYILGGLIYISGNRGERFGIVIRNDGTPKTAPIAAQTPLKTTVKPTWDEQFYACNKEAHTLISNGSCGGENCSSYMLGVMAQKRNLIDSCMKAHGYSVKWGGDK